MKRSLTIAGIIAAASLLASSSAWAQRGGGRGGGRGWMRAVKSLDPSTDQVRRISELRSAMHVKVAPLEAQLEVKRHELHALWQAKRPNRGAILAKQGEMDGLRSKIRVARTDFRLGVLGVLSAQQRQQLRTTMEQRRAWGGPGKGAGRWGKGAGRWGKGPGRGGKGRRHRGGW